MSRLEISAFVVSALFQALLCAPVAAAPGSPSPISLKVDPSEVGVDLFYSGTVVHAEGVIPAGTDAAIVCRGQERAVDLCADFPETRFVDAFKQIGGRCSNYGKRLPYVPIQIGARTSQEQGAQTKEKKEPGHIGHRGDKDAGGQGGIDAQGLETEGNRHAGEGG